MDIVKEWKEIRLVMNGARKVLVENYKSILTYTEEEIIIIGSQRRLKISGKNMKISYYNQYDLSVKGEISGINWLV